MSSARGDGLRGAGARLTAWYFCVFVASVVVVGTLESSLLARAVAAGERTTLLAHVAEYRTRVEADGVAGLASAVAMHAGSDAREAVRLRGDAGTLFEKRGPGEVPVEAFAGRGWDVVTTEVASDFELEVGRSDGAERELLGHVRDASLAALVVTMVLGLCGGAILTRRAFRPVGDLRRTAESIVRSGDLALRVPTRGTGDELDELAALVNRMLSRNETLVTGIRGALDDVAHDLKTPLTRLRAGAELALQKEAGEGPLREALADAMEESERLLTMLRTLMDVSAAETGVMRLERAPVDLCELARQVIETYDLVAEERGVRLVSHLEPTRVVGDVVRLRQMVANLVDNSIKYTPPGGVVDVVTASRGPDVELRVVDTGMGIAEGDLPRVFDRLYRADRSRGQPGLGLGLSFVKAIVSAHAGRVDVTSTVGTGTTVAVTLPRGE